MNKIVSLGLHPAQPTTRGNPFQAKAIHIRAQARNCGQEHGLGELIQKLTGYSQAPHNAQKGGLTIAYTIDLSAGNINVGFAVCKDTDMYDRQKGFHLACARMGLAGKTFVEPTAEEVAKYAFTLKVNEVTKLALATMNLNGLSKKFIERITFQDLAPNIVEYAVSQGVQARHEELGHLHQLNVKKLVDERVLRHHAEEMSRAAPAQ